MTVNTAISTWFTVAVLLSFSVDWIAVGLNWYKIKFVTKPLAMLMVILWTMINADWGISAMVGVLLLAQLLGLSGDVFLILPNTFFLYGLLAFLLGHVFYVVLVILIFTKVDQISVIVKQVVWGVLLGLLVWGIAMALFYYVFRSLSHPGAITRKFWAAIQVYGWILSSTGAFVVFLVFALGDFTCEIVLLPAGTFLFWLSDTLLAVNKFLKPIPNGQLWVRISYHFAQFSLAAGFLSLIVPS